MLLARIYYLLFAIAGNFIIWAYKLRLILPQYGINATEERKEKVIVSLTSYGRRVSKILPYTVCSLLRQSYKPDKIVVWLDCEHWNDHNIPMSLRRLVDYGLTIEYCDDIKSYKKLIPALNTYPNDIIITCDDDVYYSKDFVNRLVSAYYCNPKMVHCVSAHHITFVDSMLAPYNDWKDCYDANGKFVFPVGVGGCLYKKSFFYEDICKQHLFMKLAPNADDVWFYFMEHLSGCDRHVLPFKYITYLPLDFFYQLFYKESLSSTNVHQSQNDIQIKTVMEYYNIQVQDIFK